MERSESLAGETVSQEATETRDLQWLKPDEYATERPDPDLDGGFPQKEVR